MYGNGVPPEIRLVSAASTYPHRSQLPINLLLLIISHLDDIATLASVTRTSRLLYYLTIPRLYQRVTLQAYSSIRYIDDQPEGFGGGSPFAMGLDGLISSPNNVAQYVKKLVLKGEWKETDSKDFERGRVPDNTMILNVAIKAAISRADTLESFNWELNTKPMKTIYQGLATRIHLTHLKIVFPSSRVPRPTVLIPGLPRLKSLHVANMDPLCYNDDISLLLLEARKLEILKLHWSPRMRQEKEASTHIAHHFGPLALSKHQLRLKHLTMANMFAKNDGTLTQALDLSAAESLTFLNCMDHDNPSTVFLDTTWNPQASQLPMLGTLKAVRSNRVGTSMCSNLSSFPVLRDIYLVNNRNWPGEIEKRFSKTVLSESPSSSNGTTNQKLPSEPAPQITVAELKNGTVDTPQTNGETSINRESSQSTPRQSDSPINSPTHSNPSSIKKHISLASDYIAIITKHHGPYMRNLLLRESWTLSRDVINHILTSCPNLEQLAIAVDDFSLELLRHITTSLPKLFALRLLFTPESDLWRTSPLDHRIHEELMAHETWKDEYKNLIWLGLGPVMVRLHGRRACTDRPPYKGIVKVVSWDEVKHIEVFGLDSNDI